MVCPWKLILGPLLQPVATAASAEHGQSVIPAISQSPRPLRGVQRTFFDHHFCFRLAEDFPITTRPERPQ